MIGIPITVANQQKGTTVGFEHCSTGVIYTYATTLYDVLVAWREIVYCCVQPMKYLMKYIISSEMVRSG